MAIIRKRKNKGNYVIISRVFLKDKALNGRDRGVFSTILSLPGDWNLSVSGLAAILPDGETAIRASLNNLTKQGYLKKIQPKNADGTFSKCVYIIDENPYADAEPETEDNPHSDLPHPDLPRPDEPDTVEHRQYNNNKYNNKKNNINQYQSIYPDADEINEIREEVKDQIDYDYACMKFGEEKVDSIVDLMMEVYLSVGTICIGKKQLLAEQVKNAFRKINMDHIQYVFNSIEQTSREKKIKNMKSYLLTALYNAPMTIEAYYASESNYDYHNQEEG